MTPQVIGTLIPIVLGLGIFAMIVYLRRFENMERMAMIERGMSPAESKRQSNTSIPLRFSMLLMGFGIGLLLATLFDHFLYMNQDSLYFSLILIFGGLGLGVAYIVEEKKAKAESEEEKNLGK
jgi:hypothetical protein